MSAARTTSSKGASKPKAKVKPKAKAKAKPTAVADTPSRQPMRRTIRGGRPYFFADPAIDKLLNMLVVLGSEVWTLRERLAALEAIQIRQGGLAAGELDAHEFSAEDESRLAAERKEFIDSLFRILQEQVEEARRR
ncbi:MAG: hypothetical protein FJ179_09100 [Gammaproteobacteria bacterium]|nr:hypothetical protein [Gammaproteobacteria bacterium]